MITKVHNAAHFLIFIFNRGASESSPRTGKNSGEPDSKASSLTLQTLTPTNDMHTKWENFPEQRDAKIFVQYPPGSSASVSQFKVLILVYFFNYYLEPTIYPFGHCWFHWRINSWFLSYPTYVFPVYVLQDPFCKKIPKQLKHKLCYLYLLGSIPHFPVVWKQSAKHLTCIIFFIP